jgi:pseudouridine-5'-phosphate glycosidase
VPEEFEVDQGELTRSLDEALDAAARERVAGRELTPFLLSHMGRRTKGSTLRANIALLENHAHVARGNREGRVGG